MPVLVDANVILRYLLDDVPEQAERAQAAIRAGAYTVDEVVAEVVYVLSGVYELSRRDIAEALTQLLDEVDVDNRAVVLVALRVFAEDRIDFVDAVLVARSRVLAERIVTFDKKLNKLLGVQ
ncbi:putative nucleic-acid-binding protein [Arcanobacterium wilhelmae]|uniref:Nucleic-acid-binding protein n=1 Tax=Arcanobacterium wilhelmae TaxID=1803177 RepID=A0ABT9N8V7_9ACTO|nr:PIN domain-containing protein [Arcanobacterium wilhelmae]MDP9800137.1 putative nucleic-acid-binding protein [Arcanobacterium wilhelmae]WFN89578.1 PIN domain-containing protein [Arcanobacterium wilhelmae]